MKNPFVEAPYDQTIFSHNLYFLELISALHYVVFAAKDYNWHNFALHYIMMTATIRLHVFLFTLHYITSSKRNQFCDTLHYGYIKDCSQNWKCNSFRSQGRVIIGFTAFRLVELEINLICSYIVLQPLAVWARLQLQEIFLLWAFQESHMITVAGMHRCRNYDTTMLKAVVGEKGVLGPVVMPLRFRIAVIATLCILRFSVSQPGIGKTTIPKSWGIAQKVPNGDW